MRIFLAVLIITLLGLSAAHAASDHQVWRYYEKVKLTDPWTLYGEHKHDKYGAEERARKGIGSRCGTNRFQDIAFLKAVRVSDGKTFELDCMASKRRAWPEDFNPDGTRKKPGPKDLW